MIYHLISTNVKRNVTLTLFRKINEKFLRDFYYSPSSVRNFYAFKSGSATMKTKLKYRSQLLSRWLALLLICVFMSFVYFAYDNPAALHDQLRDHFRHVPLTEFEYQFNLLYSTYSLPNIVLPFFGGVFVDKYGAENCCLAFLSIITVGQILVLVGVSCQSFSTMLAGRALFGIGGESVMVASSMLLQAWFRN